MEKQHYQVYKMSKKLHNKTQRHQVQNKKNKGQENYGHYGIGQWGNRQGTRQDQSRGITRIYLTICTPIQQEKV